MGGGEEVGARPSLRLLLSISEDAELRLPRALSLSLRANRVCCSSFVIRPGEAKRRRGRTPTLGRYLGIKSP